MDHLLPLYVREQGGLVVYVPDAVATDRPISGLREQFRSRTRTATRGIRANLSMAGRLAPWRRPTAALAIWSHKLLRWATPLLGFVAVLAATGLGARWRDVAWVVPASRLAGLLAAGIAHVLVRAGRTPPRVIAFARAFAVVNAAFVLAVAERPPAPADRDLAPDGVGGVEAVSQAPAGASGSPARPPGPHEPVGSSPVGRPPAGTSSLRGHGHRLPQASRCRRS